MIRSDLQGDWVAFGCFVCAGCLSVLVFLSSPLSVSGAAGTTHKFPKAAAGFHGATGRSANGAGTAREDDISLHQTVTSSSKCHRLQRRFLLHVLPAVPAAISAWMQAQVLLPVCPPLGAWWAQGLHQQGGTDSSEMPPQQLEKYPAALCGAGRLLESGAQQRVQ